MRRYTDSFHERLEMLGVGLPDEEPRATEHIPEMISLIQELIERGHAYAPLKRQRRLLRRRELPELRQAFPPASRGDARDREGPDGLQEKPPGLRPVESVEAGRASWESPWGRGARAGTSSARRWSRSTCPPARTCTVAAPTSSSPTTRTSSPRAAGRIRTTPSSAPGSTTAVLRPGQDGKVHRQRGGRRGGRGAPRQ